MLPHKIQYINGQFKVHHFSSCLSHLFLPVTVLVQSKRQCNHLFFLFFSNIREESILGSSKCFLNEERREKLHENTLNT